MKIIDSECLACASFETCGTEVMKGSIMCCSNRISNRQTKKQMYDKITQMQPGKENSNGKL